MAPMKTISQKNLPMSSITISDRPLSVLQAVSDAKVMKSVLRSKEAFPMDASGFRQYLSTLYATESVDCWTDVEIYLEKEGVVPKIESSESPQLVTTTKDAESGGGGCCWSGGDSAGPAADDVESKLSGKETASTVDRVFLVDEYFKTHAEKEVNLPSALKKNAVLTSHTDVEFQDSMIKVQMELEKLMTQNFLANFLRTIHTTNLTPRTANGRVVYGLAWMLLAVGVAAVMNVYELPRWSIGVATFSPWTAGVLTFFSGQKRV